MAKFFCVRSPFVDLCSLEEVERLPDGVRSRVVLRPELMNSWGGAHGGLIATLLDASMTVAARYAVDPEGQQAVATVIDASSVAIRPPQGAWPAQRLGGLDSSSEQDRRRRFDKEERRRPSPAQVWDVLPELGDRHDRGARSPSRPKKPALRRR